MSRGGLLIIVMFLFYGVNLPAQKGEGRVTKQNYKEKIFEQFDLILKGSEDLSKAEEVFKFLMINDQIVLEDSIKGKYLYLKGMREIVSLSRFDEAEKYYNEALKLAENNNDFLLQGLIYNDKGVMCTDLVEQVEFYLKALDCYKKVNAIPKILESYYNLTVSTRLGNNWAMSISYGKKCLELMNGDHDLLLFYNRIYYFMADSYRKMGMYDEAIKNLKIAEDYHKITHHKNKTRTYRWINDGFAKVYKAQKKYQLSLENYKKANNSLVELNNQINVDLTNGFEKELSLQTQSRYEKEQIINDQGKILMLSITTVVLLVFIVLSLVEFIRRNRSKNKNISTLNKELKNVLKHLKNKNNDLIENKNKIEHLLKLNEQALFSRVLKISTYNDAIGKINDEIDSYIDKNVNGAVFLNAINTRLYKLVSEEELWEDFKIQFEKIRPNFFKKLKELAPDLSINDLKHCTYIVSNLKSKEVAQLINVSPRSVETTRYRIKKKIGLEKKESLYDVLSTM